MSNAKRRPTVGDKVRVICDPENRYYVTVGKVYTIRKVDESNTGNRQSAQPYDIGGDNARGAWMQSDWVELVEESPEPGTIESLEAKIKELSADLEAMKAAKEAEKKFIVAPGIVFEVEGAPYIMALHGFQLTAVSLRDGSVFTPPRDHDYKDFKYIGLAKDVLSVKVP